MDKFMEKLKNFWKIVVGYWKVFLVYWKKFVVFCKNKWTKFTVASIIYTLLFVVWPGNLWFLFGLPLIYDHFISRIFYRYVGSKNEALRKKYKIYNTIYGWVDAIIWATVVAHLIHLFVFQLYVVPTSSMAGTIVEGDYIYVSKLAYGPQVPNTPVAMPFVFNTMPFSSNKSYSECVQWDYHRLRGRGKVQRNDVIVFNYPEGDMVIRETNLDGSPIFYYDELRKEQSQHGEEKGREIVHGKYTVISHPVDKRENYIKRCVAVPGDSLQIVDTKLYVNNLQQAPRGKQQHQYDITANRYLLEEHFTQLGISEFGSYANQPYMYFAHTTEEVADKLRKYREVESVELHNEKHNLVFPYHENYPWTQDNFGPLWVPYKGATIKLTVDNLPLYKRIIEKYEGHSLQVKDEKIFIDGKETDSYTFAMDYFFMMGDNRHNSLDSRFWGFVPEDHIVGKALFIIFSKGPDGIRWNRILKKIE